MIQVIINAPENTDPTPIHNMLFGILKHSGIMAHVITVKTPFTMELIPPKEPDAVLPTMDAVEEPVKPAKKSKKK